MIRPIRVLSAAALALAIAGASAAGVGPAEAGHEAPPYRQAGREAAPYSVDGKALRGGVRHVPRAGRPRHAAEPCRLRPGDPRLHRLLVRHARAGRRLGVGHPARRPRARVRPAHAGLPRRPDRRRDPRHPRAHPHDVHRPGVAARRTQPAAAAAHGEGLSRKRGGADDNVQHGRRQQRQQRVPVRAAHRLAHAVGGQGPDRPARDGRHAGLAARPWRRQRRPQARARALARSRQHPQRGRRGHLPHRQGRPWPRQRHHIFEPFVAFGQILPGDSFVQAHAALELPADSGKAPREALWRVAAGRTFAQDGGSGRAWSPMVELLAARELRSGS
jgi:hypothetical protein